MFNWLKFWFAKWMSNRFVVDKNNITEQDSIRWNFLQGQVLSHGRVKWDWDKFKGLKKPKCNRCLHKFGKKEEVFSLKESVYCEKCYEKVIK